MLDLPQQMDSLRSYNNNINNNVNQGSSNSNTTHIDTFPVQLDKVQNLKSVTFGERNLITSCCIHTTSNKLSEDSDDDDVDDYNVNGARPQKRGILFQRTKTNLEEDRMLQEKTRNPARKHVFFCIDFIEEGDIKRFKINNENVVKISKAGRNEATIELNTLPIYVKNISDWSLPNQDYENYKWEMYDCKSFLSDYFNDSHYGSGINKNNLFLNITIASDSSLDWIGCSSSGT